jgi:hypothetical protein
MSTNLSMSLPTHEQRRVSGHRPAPTRPRPVARAPRRQRNRQLVIALGLVILAGFLLGLGLPIHR